MALNQNNIFMVVPQADSSKIVAAAVAKYPDDYYPLAHGAFLVAAQGKTTKGISDELGISGGDNGSAVVVAVSSYFGRANPQIWEWMKAKMGGGANA